MPVLVAVTGTVVTVNVAEVAPAGIVTDAGTVAALFASVRVTIAPDAGALPFSVTVPVDDAPPTTVAGLRLRLDSEGALTVRVAVLVFPLYAAETVTTVSALTAEVVTVNVALVAPAAMVTLAGTEAAAETELESETTAPPAGAAPFRVTVPVELTPPITEVGLSEIVLMAAALTVRVAVVAPLYVAVMVAVCTEATGLVLIEKLVDIAPAATVTDPGTLTAASLEESATTAPELPAASARVTVPVAVAPPNTEVGVTETLLTPFAGLTDSTADFDPL